MGRISLFVGSKILTSSAAHQHPHPENLENPLNHNGYSDRDSRMGKISLFVGSKILTSSAAHQHSHPENLENPLNPDGYLRALEDLNPRHSVLETDVLPTELKAQI